MAKRSHAVAELPQFVRDAERLGLSADEIAAIVNAVARDPLVGDEIQGSGGVRKRRFASVGSQASVRRRRFAGRGKGKSGGYRAITAYFGPDVPVYLIALLSKGERSNFSRVEIAGFKRLIGEIARHWRRRIE